MGTPTATASTEEAPKFRRIAAQPGPQTAFLATPADIAIMGGSAFGGKSFALCLEPTRHVHNPGFGTVIFRREGTQIRAQGGLWDTASSIYLGMGAHPVETKLDFHFPHLRKRGSFGARVSFRHLEHEDDRFKWDGSQIPLLAFDELQHFTAAQFWYLLGRNRSTCGVRPYLRAACNPHADSFLAGLLAWWIDQQEKLPDGRPNPRYGLAIPERSGKLRWFYKLGDELHWFASRKEAASGRRRLGVPADVEPKSLTFIRSRLEDNPIGIAANPDYKANLYAQSLVDRARLLDGNWKIRESAGNVFKRSWFEIVDAVPAGGTMIRYWDRAATEPHPANPDPDWTAGVKMKRVRDEYFVIDVVRDRVSAGKVLRLIRNTAQQDEVTILHGLEEDPGQSGKVDVSFLIRNLAGFNVRAFRPQGGKVVRANPFSAQGEAGNVKLLRGPWNDAFLAELEAFPDGPHDDQVDAGSGAFNYLSSTALDYGALTQM